MTAPQEIPDAAELLRARYDPVTAMRRLAREASQTVDLAKALGVVRYGADE